MVRAIVHVLMTAQTKTLATTAHVYQAPAAAGGGPAGLSAFWRLVTTDAALPRGNQRMG